MKWLIFFFVFFSIVSIASPREENGFEIDVSVDKGDDATYYDGEPIFISFRMTEDGYIVVYDIDTEGNLNLIFPESADEDGFIRANKTYQIPEDNDDYSFKVNGPPGEEFICAVASSEPLRIPSIFEEGDGANFRVKGDRIRAIEKITNEILGDRSVIYETDICHFYVEYSEGEKASFPPAPFPSPPFSCSMKIISRPPGAKLYLDGRYFGKTPVGVFGIPPGIHRLLLTKKGFYRYKKKIHLYQGDRRSIRVDLRWKFW